MSDVVIEQVLPLTPAQQGMLFHSMDEGSGHYLQQFDVSLAGRLAPDEFRRAWQVLTERHDVLRTAVLSDEADEPIQVVLGEVVVPFTVLDWSGSPAAATPARWERLLADDRAAGLNLAKAPLFRLTLVNLGADRWRLIWTFHHLLLDGWSVSLVLAELMHIYNGTGTDLPPARPFADYLDWLQHQKPATAEQFWTSELAGAQPDTPPPTTDTTATGVGEVHRTLPEDLTNGLTTLARTARTTVSACLLAAWSTVLTTTTGTTETTIGVVTAGRPPELPGVESMVGMFVNTLPIRIPSTATTPVHTFIHQVGHRQWAAQEHGHTSLVDIHRWAGLPPGTPLFSTLYAYENYPVRDTDASGAALRITGVGSAESADYPLSLIVTSGSRLGLRLVFDRAVFEESVVRGYAARLEHVLTAMITNPDHPLAHLPTVDTGTERDYAVWNATTRTYPRDTTLTTLFTAQAQRTPDAIAIADDHTQITYRQTHHHARILADRLHHAGVRPGDTVGLCLRRSPAMVPAILAVVRLGAAYVPLDPTHPAARIAHMLTDSGARVVLADDHTATLPLLDAAGVRVVGVAVPPGHPVPASPAPAEPAVAQSIACVVYTSGSTGRPKGIALTHRGIVRTVVGTDHVRFGPHDVVAQVCNTSFDPFLWELWGALLNGGRVQVIAEDDVLSPTGLSAAFARHGVTACVLPTALLHQVARAAPDCFRDLREVLFGGEAADPAAARAILAAGGPRRLQNGYGPAEGTLITSGYAVREVPAGTSRLPIGRPVANTRVYVLDRWGRPCPPLTAGEVVIAGDGLALGYVGQPARTAEAFRPDPYAQRPGTLMYHTGDRALRRLDGELDFAGRDDDQVKLRGFRVEPGEIEAVLSGHPEVAGCVVLPERNAAGVVTRLVGYVVPAAPRAGDLTAGLREYLSARLPDYLVPGALVQVAEFPLTPNGKIDRVALSAVPRPGPAAGYVAPRDEPERVLAGLFAAALGAARVGVHDHFLDLGGDSISAIGVTARAQAHGLVFAARDVLRLGTPAALAAAAGRTRVPAPQGVLDGPVCATPIQRWYLERDLPEPGYFSQAVLLAVPPEGSVAVLRQALDAVLAHHDALRIRVDSAGGAPRLFHVAPGDVPCTVRRHGAADAQELLAEAVRAQQALGVEKGDSLAAVLFTGLDPDADRLLLAVHHLLVDVVSWPVLLGDLESAYRAVEDGRQPRFPRKTTSFQQWARHLSDWAAGPAAGAALDWWTTALDVPVPPVPTDAPEGDPAAPFGDERSAGVVEISLDRAATGVLTGRGSAAGGPRAHELLTAALAVGYRRWSGHDRLLLDVEGHGRSPLSDGLDVSRTVGWFTALHPVVLDLAGAPTTAAALGAVVDRLRAVPQDGVGHGALRYSGGEAAARLAAFPAPQVAFNYVGAFRDRVERAGGWRMAPEPLGPERAPGNPRAHLLAVQGHLVDGRLHLTFEFSGDRHRRESVARLAEHVHAALAELAEPAPADLPCLLPDTTAEELHDLLDEVDFSDDRE